MPLPQENNSLAARLAPVLAGHFFRPLARPSAPIYIECAERLVKATDEDESGQLSHDDARAIINDILRSHPNATLADDEGGLLADITQRAGQLYNQLCAAQWLQERRVSFTERWVLVTPGLRLLVRFLGDLAKNRPADLKDFAGTLRSICDDLLQPRALDPNGHAPEIFRQKIWELLDRTERAITQLHTVETIILEHETAQRASESARETLHRALVSFHEGEHMTCHDALLESGLLSRIAQARDVVREATYDHFTKLRLAEGIAKHRSLDDNDNEAFAEAESQFTRLEHLLASIPGKQRAIDGRISDFSTLSAARYRYQTEMRGRRAEQVQSCLNALSKQHTGQSFSDLANLSGLDLRSVKVDAYRGASSLAFAYHKRPPVNLAFSSRETNDDDDIETAKDLIRGQNLNVLTPQRAARFIEKYLPAKGARISTNQFRVHTSDDFLDLLAALCFDQGHLPQNRHLIRWRAHPDRLASGTEPEKIPLDAHTSWIIEHFTLERLS